MESNNPTPQQTPAGEPMPPAEQPVQPQAQPTIGGGPKKSKSPLIILLIIVLLLATGAGAYYFFSMKDGGKKTANNNTAATNTTADNTGTDEEESATTTSSFTNPDTGIKVSVDHPKDWAVTTDPDKYGEKQLLITSDKGNYLKMSINMGVGGDCGGPNNYSYTLVKKLATQDPLTVFTEYTTTNPNNAHTGFRLESLKGASAAHKAMTDGQSNTDTCTNLFIYPIVDGDIFVHIGTATASDTDAPYTDYESDTEFITMLQSLRVDRAN